MIQASDIGTIVKDLLPSFDQGSFTLFFSDEVKLRFGDYAGNNKFPIQLTECLNALYQEGRLPELLIKAAAFRPGNVPLQAWSARAKVIERAKSAPESIVTLLGSKVFIGRDDLKQKLNSNLRNKQSWVIQLQSGAPKSGMSYCFWYFKHRANLMNDVSIIEINIRKINEREGLPVAAIHLATAINDKLDLEIELPEDSTRGIFKSSRFLDRFVGAMAQKKDIRYLMFLDQFRDAQITEDAKGFIKGLIETTRELDNLCIVTSFSETLDRNEIPLLEMVKTDSFSETELRDFLKKLYEELPIHTQRPNEDTEADFVQNGMDILSSELAQKPNVEAVGVLAQDFFIQVSQPHPNDD